jgi:hypothetical protein
MNLWLIDYVTTKKVEPTLLRRDKERLTQGMSNLLYSAIKFANVVSTINDVSEQLM